MALWQHDPSVPLPPDGLTLFAQKMIEHHPNLVFRATGGGGLTSLERDYEFNSHLADLYFSSGATIQPNEVQQIRAQADAEAKDMWNKYCKSLFFDTPYSSTESTIDIMQHFYVHVAKVAFGDEWARNCARMGLLWKHWDRLSVNEKEVLRLRAERWDYIKRCSSSCAGTPEQGSWEGRELGELYSYLPIPWWAPRRYREDGV